MQMQRIRRGKNIVEAGFEDGVLTVRFASSGEYRWAGVPQDKFESLLRTPYPDRYFTQAIKSKFTVIQKPQKPVPADVVFTDREDYYAGEERKVAERVAQAIAADNHKETRQERREVERKRYATMEIFRAEDGLTFEPEGHRYMLDGKRVMSLTQILEAAGLVDYSMVKPDVLAAKAALGTKVHEYTLWSDQGELDMDDLKPYTKYWTRVEGWRQFVQDFRFVPSLDWCEVPCAVKCNGMLYAMTIDRFGFMDPEPGKDESPVPCVVEVKTCWDREFSHQIQTAGQAIPFKGDGSVPPVKRFAVYLLDKLNGADRYYTVQEHTDRMDEKVFLASLMLTHSRINNGLLKGI